MDNQRQGASAAVTAARWEDAEKTSIAAAIDGRAINGITPESRFWADIEAYITGGGVVADYEPPVPDRADEIRARLEAIDESSRRPLRSLEVARIRDEPPDADDAAKLAALDAEAAALRAELAALNMES